MSWLGTSTCASVERLVLITQKLPSNAWSVHTQKLHNSRKLHPLQTQFQSNKTVYSDPLYNSTYSPGCPLGYGEGYMGACCGYGAMGIWNGGTGTGAGGC